MGRADVAAAAAAHAVLHMEAAELIVFLLAQGPGDQGRRQMHGTGGHTLSAADTDPRLMLLPTLPGGHTQKGVGVLDDGNGQVGLLGTHHGAAGQHQIGIFALPGLPQHILQRGADGHKEIAGTAHRAAGNGNDPVGQVQ